MSKTKTTLCLLAISLMLLSNRVTCINVPDIEIKEERTGIPCTGYNQQFSTFFRFNPSSKEPNRIDFDVKDVKFEDKVWQGTAIVDFCTPQLSKDSDCPLLGTDKSIGYFKLVNPETKEIKCLPISNQTDPSNWKITPDTENLTRDRKKPGFYINLVESETQQSALKIKFKLACSTPEHPINYISDFDDKTGLLTLASGRPGFCGEKVGGYAMLLTKYKFLSAILLIVAIFLIFFGNKFIQAVLFSIGFLLGFIISLIIAIFALIMLPNTWIATILVIVGVILLSLALGYVFSKLTKLYLILAGGFLGVSVGSLLYGLIVLVIGSSSDTLRNVIFLAFFIFGMIFGYYIHDHVLILATSLGGAHFFSVALGSILSLYPDYSHYEILKLLGTEGQKYSSKLVQWSWVWFLVTVVVGVLGAVYQYKVRADLRAKGELEENKDLYFKNGPSAALISNPPEEDSRL